MQTGRALLQCPEAAGVRAPTRRYCMTHESRRGGLAFEALRPTCAGPAVAVAVVGALSSAGGASGSSVPHLWLGVKA